MIIGDKGYISRQQQINLFETAGIELEVTIQFLIHDMFPQ